MPNASPRSAMVLAAGLGLRMRPLTDTLPKPLVKVWNRTLLDHALDRLAEAGVETVVVNLHHLADQIVAHLAGRSSPRIVFSDEQAALLETGGGIAKALKLLGPEPFFVLNSDSLWVEGPRPNLHHLAAHFDAARMDALLMLAPTVTAVGYAGRGDFTMEKGGRLQRRRERQVAPFVYAGTAIMSPRWFENCPSGAFSLNLLFDRALQDGRLFGLRMDGLWLHVGTPAAIAEAEQRLAASAA